MTLPPRRDCRGVIEPDGDGHRVMVASAGMKQIDAVAEVLFDADDWQLRENQTQEQRMAAGYDVTAQARLPFYEHINT
jgi:hypothetical protein